MLARLALLLLVSTTTLASTVEIPDVIQYNVPGAIDPPPAWISERAAIDENGELRRELFGAQESALRELLESNPGGCTVFRGLPFDHHPTDQTPESLARNAQVIVSGTVVASAQGLYAASPATLLAVKIEDSIRARVSLPSDGVVYVPVRDARIRTRSGWLCSSFHRVDMPIPAVGDRLLLFGIYRPNDERGAIVDVHPGLHLVVQKRGERKLVPNALAQKLGSAKQLDEVAGEIRACLRRESPRTRSCASRDWPRV